MLLQNLASLLPKIVFMLGDMGNLLDGLDFIGMIFGIINELTFLVDIIIGAALVAAIIRGIFKKFWKVVWRGVIFLILIAALFIFKDQIAGVIGNLPISLKGRINGTTDIEFANFAQVINGVIIESGKSAAYAEEMTVVIMSNFVLFFGLPAIAIVTPIVSGITYPLFSLLLPKKVQKIKLLPVKLVISIGFTFIAVMIFAVPMSNLVPSLLPFRETMTEGSLLQKFLNPEIIGFMNLFTAENSIFIRIVNMGQVQGSLNFFTSFVDGSTTVELGDAITEVLTALDAIPYESAAIV